VSRSRAGNSALLYTLPPAGGPVTTVVPVTNEGMVGEARRTATALAESLFFDEVAKGRVAIVVTELATNLARHATGGELLLRHTGTGARAPDGQGRSVLEIVATDRGPGIDDIDRSRRDGFSTGGTAGTGLGAIERMTERFDFFSQPAVGTVIACEIGMSPITRPPIVPRFDLGIVCVPSPGERSCGDGWEAHHRPDETVVLMVVDGLGHGPQAAAAADAACASFAQSMQRMTTAAETLERVHLALRATRGAAVAIAEVDPVKRTVHFAGVGNVSGVVIGERSQSMVSLSGIAGHQVGRLREFVYDWPVGATVILASDGLATRWSLEKYPGILRHHPSVVSSLLYREHTRGRDDVTVVAFRERPEEAE
jgi:anti-sigma regulatory factor (Ser/Thr protein kinase)